MKLERGTYKTRNGSTAHIWEWHKDRQLWRGTVEGGGLNEWREDGRDYYGTREWDIIEDEKQEVKS